MSMGRQQAHGSIKINENNRLDSMSLQKRKETLVEHFRSMQAES